MEKGGGGAARDGGVAREARGPIGRPGPARALESVGARRGGRGAKKN